MKDSIEILGNPNLYIYKKKSKIKYSMGYNTPKERKTGRNTGKLKISKIFG